MSTWVEGRVSGQTRWTDRLLSLQVQAPAPPFEAGQFARLALDIGDERVARPYSFVNPPGSTPLEFYYVLVPQGPLSPRLAALQPGDAVYLAQNPAGFLVLSEVPDADNLWLIASGTGIGPFLSILRSDAVWQRFARVVLVHAVRVAAELAYREVIEAVRTEHAGRFAFVPFVSREQAAGALAGRIPTAIGDGRLEAAARCELTAAGSHAMLCGNPDMVRDVTAALAGRGMRKHRRRVPGHITLEAYW